MHLAASAICRGSHVTLELGVLSLELLHVTILKPTFKHQSHKVSLVQFATFSKATISLVMSVRLSARNNSAPNGRIFMKFDI